MKNVIKKTCAIVMMTAVLFTAVAPTPVFATCPHPGTETIDLDPEYYTSTTHNYNGKVCTVYIYKKYKATRCKKCYHIFSKWVVGTTEKHSLHNYVH